MNTHSEKTTDFFRVVRALDTVQGNHDWQVADQWDIRYMLHVLKMLRAIAAGNFREGVAMLDTGNTPAGSRHKMNHTTLTIRNGDRPWTCATRELADTTPVRWRYQFRLYPMDSEGFDPHVDSFSYVKQGNRVRDECGACYVHFYTYHVAAARDWAHTIGLDTVRDV